MGCYCSLLVSIDRMILVKLMQHRDLKKFTEVSVISTLNFMCLCVTRAFITLFFVLFHMSGVRFAIIRSLVDLALKKCRLTYTDVMFYRIS